MVTLPTFINRLSGLQKFATEKMKDIVLGYSKKITDLSNSQLLKGLNVEGKVIQKGYSRTWGKARKLRGLQTQFVDLKYSGNFQNGSKVVAVGEGFDIQSDVDYEADLRDRYGNIRGLTEEQAEEIANLAAEKMAVYIKNYLIK